MVIPKFDIKTFTCDKLVITDITPEGTTHGYGGLNINRNEIQYVEFTFDYGHGVKPKVGKIWSPDSSEPIVIDIADLSLTIDSKTGYVQGFRTVTAFTECGEVCDICIPDIFVETDTCTCRAIGFPEGCVKITYEVFSKSLPSGKYKTEGLNIVNHIFRCNLDKDIADFAARLVLPTSNCNYKFKSGRDVRKETMENVILAWQKLNLLTVDGPCDCDCVALQMKQIRTYLTYAKNL